MRFRFLPAVALLLAGGTLTAQASPDLTLDQLLEIGLENNSDIRIAERNLMAAKAGRRGSYSGLVPSLRASFQRDLKTATFRDPITNTRVETERGYGSQASLIQTIYDGGASWYNASAGRNEVQSAQAALDRARQQSVLAIKQAYFSSLSRLELLEVAEEALELSRRQLELVVERYRLQAVKKTDLLKAKVSVGQREADRHRAQQNVSTAITSLLLALGQDPVTRLSVARDSVTVEPLPQRQVAFGSLRANHPALRVQARAVERAWLNAKMQRGVLLPTISLSYAMSASGIQLNDAYDFDYENEGTARLNVSIPLFTGLQSTSRYSRLRYAALAEEERLDALERDLKGQLENTLSSLESLHQIHPLNREILNSAEADVRLAEEQYRLGAISILDLLDAQVSLITARSTLVRTTYEIKIAEAELQALMGVAVNTSS
ncbi:MAG: TolC family protein [Candidatus Neomarinimicrobiota bacterium]